jgi:hypothetical protein
MIKTLSAERISLAEKAGVGIAVNEAFGSSVVCGKMG